MNSLSETFTYYQQRITELKADCERFKAIADRLIASSDTAERSEARQWYRLHAQAAGELRKLVPLRDKAAPEDSGDDDLATMFQAKRRHMEGWAQAHSKGTDRISEILSNDESKQREQKRIRNDKRTKK